ncbi:hypothetical protein HYH03_018220 [Edaphochlamys debaryana]|uniref:CrcB-like protein n=1 Tax=Edaphochlamys debaryana TaxID=47281 RepID=A0A836BN53_9CHLO|nr:hypothetical protein HYH03_018220 [Edaphochlamys debaryana]|eukprot:KAG2482876.1 hypothetical protein HYH03_018220 [Edaphochlamys debaryana]
MAAAPPLWQRHTALHLGLRTGFCGSLTTFSSWVLQIVVLMVGRTSSGHPHGTQWVAGLWAAFLGLAGPLVALVLGQHTALAFVPLWQRHRSTDAAGKASSRGRSARGKGGRAVAEAIEQAARDTEAGGAGSSSADSASQNGTPGPEDTPLEPPPLVMVSTQLVSVGSSGTRGAAGAAAPEPRIETVAQALDEAAAELATAVDAGPPAAAPPLPEPAREPLVSVLSDVAAAATLLTLTGVSAAYAYLDRTGGAGGDPGRRFLWLAVLFGPPGCILRWYLSRFNTAPAAWTALGGGWGWLQLGTFVANLAACLLNFVAEAVIFRLGGRGSLTQLQTVCLQGLMTGTAGCLSTVSTWVVELQKLSLGASPAGSYRYALTSLVLPIALGLLIYGLPAWTAASP